jgi:HD-like signal output (HDOD) protein
MATVLQRVAHNMADELFGNRRFKPAPTKPSLVDDDSGQDYRTSGKAKTIQIGETELLAEVDHVQSLPEVVQKILALVGDQQSSARDLEELIKNDMVIAGRLLKLVNSPFYGLSKQIASISQAVNIVGLASLRSLVLAASASNLMVIDLGVYGFKPQGLWKNSISTAGLSRDIAKLSGVGKDDAEEFFLAGLMRDVGMLVLGPLLARNGVVLRKIEGGNEDILSRERQLIGFDHSWVGERVAEKWRLPANLALAIGKHHRIPGTLAEAQLKQLAIVRLAERLAYSAGAGVLPDHPFDARIDPQLLKLAGLTAASFQTLIAQVPAIVAKAENSLS